MVASFAAGVVVAGKLIGVIKGIVAALRSVASAQAIVTALSGPKGWLQLAAGLAFAAASVYAVEKAFDSLVGAATQAAPEISDVMADVQGLAAEINSSLGDIDASLEELSRGPLEEAYQQTRMISEGFGEAEAAANRIFQSTRTPAERLAAKVREINQLFQDGLINADTARRAFDQLKEQGGKPIAVSPRRLETSRVQLGAIGAGAATGRLPEQERLEREQLEEARRRRQIQEQTLEAIRNTRGSDSLKVVNF